MNFDLKAKAKGEQNSKDESKKRKAEEDNLENDLKIALKKL